MSFRAERENATAVSKWPQRSNITSEATYELEFELLDLDNLSSYVSLASKCHNSQNIGTAIFMKVSCSPLLLDYATQIYMFLCFSGILGAALTKCHQNIYHFLLHPSVCVSRSVWWAKHYVHARKNSEELYPYQMHVVFEAVVRSNRVWPIHGMYIHALILLHSIRI